MDTMIQRQSEVSNFKIRVQWPLRCFQFLVVKYKLVITSKGTEYGSDTLLEI